MSTQLTRKEIPIPGDPFCKNWMVFPRELRSAIPDLHGGRILEIDSLSGNSSNTRLFGSLVEVKLVVKETGELRGTFVLSVALQADAARQLAATLTQLADQAEGPESAS
jgi:hypothetical protein